MEEHEKDLERVREEIAVLRKEEQEKEEQELETARQRQRAIDDLDKGVSFCIFLLKGSIM